MPVSYTHLDVYKRQLKYKKEVGDSSEEISAELRECAEVIAQTDERMLKIRLKIESEGITVTK